MEIRIFLCLVWLAFFSASAQSSIETNCEPRRLEPGHVVGGGAVAARALALAKEANDPTAPLTLVQFRDVLVPHVPGYDTPGNSFQIEPVFPIFPSRLLPFEQLVKMTLPFPTTPNPGSQSGLGDFQLFDLVSIKQSWGRWGFGPAFIFPTATASSLGQGKFQAGPALGLVYTSITNLTIGAVVQNPVSFAGDSSRPPTSALGISPTLTYNLPHGWFAGFSDFDMTFDWRKGGAPPFQSGCRRAESFPSAKCPSALRSRAPIWLPVPTMHRVGLLALSSH